MTQAVCFKCGEIKFGAFMLCSHCSATPSADEDLVLSLSMTDHYLDLATLKRIGGDIKIGKFPHLDEESRQYLLKELQEFKKNPLSNLMPANVPAPAKKKSKWWSF
ncbi:hypothetical protein [Colwellia sp. BRX8-9]|uniref:hypothetical protein n=1 Tax=Colwellia sp. BRX8-9 TaxID=2759831 RepID=UPI0015F428FA|nr:hypothetical protein [Colwellia sp. BRX8-9]MBA6348812.1 hypothetical protein [Colwellia sp. BRX8-9]